MFRHLSTSSTVNMVQCSTPQAAYAAYRNAAQPLEKADAAIGPRSFGESGSGVDVRENPAMKKGVAPHKQLLNPHLLNTLHRHTAYI